MKNQYISCLVWIPFFLSCTDREELETQELILEILKSELATEDHIHISENSYTDWFITTGLNNCSKDEFVELQKKAASAFPNGKMIEIVFSESDIKKICKQGSENFRYSENHLPLGVKIVPQEYFDKIAKEYIEFLSDKNLQISDERYNEMLKPYFRFSKPVFLHSYKYAFIYYSENCSGGMCRGSSMLFYEKNENKWEMIVSIQLTMS